MQLLKTHRAYPSAIDPDEFAFTRGVQFDLTLVAHRPSEKRFVLAITTSTGKHIMVEFKETNNYEYHIGSIRDDKSLERFAEMFVIVVGPKTIGLEKQILRFEVKLGRLILELVHIPLSLFPPADFFADDRYILDQVLRERNAQPAPLSTP